MSATPSGTRSYFESHPLKTNPSLLGKTGWTVSPIGFGGYRVADSEDAHAAALSQALLSGCNLIDTSTNYTNGGSELLVGKVLGDLFRDKKLSREQVVVVTKVGYVQGNNLELAHARMREDRPFPEMVHYQPDCWHCISPEFLDDQITRSLQRLKLDRIDVLLLHNPEYFLKAHGDHREYYARIKKAFEHLETEVKRGRIQYYGISSNTFPAPKDYPEYTSLETALEIASSLGDSNHFAVIQFPLNLFEPDAALERNNSGKTVLELAQAANLGTLANRPLNAFTEEKMIRLADFPRHDEADLTLRLKEFLTAAMGLESRYPADDFIPARKIAWGHILKENFEKLSDPDTWHHVLNHQIRPTLAEVLPALEHEPEYEPWADDYRHSSEGLFQAFTDYVEHQASQNSQEIARRLDSAAPELASSTTLSRKAIRIYRSLPGLSCVLLGMRKPQYVRDALESLEPPLKAEAAMSAIEAVFSE